MKKILLSLITVMIFGTTTSFGRTNSPKVEKDGPHTEEVMHHDGNNHDGHHGKKDGKSWRHRHQKKTVVSNGLPIKKREISVSMQTLRF